ncbi:hypothetical protein F2P81_022124 [Scophthalmus maximus]|uniref:Uncharacterized protein n=1 Tax=Scophthalmus maximus TaxID=52904 RepID=A0A6A4RTA0_SCOMX|nr:hypothetical protein F2P81_022124 [Scophthalmus maximus]
MLLGSARSTTCLRISLGPPRRRAKGNSSFVDRPADDLRRTISGGRSPADDLRRTISGGSSPARGGVRVAARGFEDYDEPRMMLLHILR